MKTYQEFMQEALAAWIVKAAAKQLVKRAALKSTKSALPRRTIRVPRTVTGFKTGRGSTYTYNREPGKWPTTQRTAPNDPYHPTPAGVKQKSDATIFTTPDSSLEMSHRFSSGQKDFSAGLPISTKPKIGRAPVEVWNNYGEKSGRSAIHPGSRITDIKSRSNLIRNRIEIPQWSSQRAELKQRVRTGLRRPANIEALKRELEKEKEIRKQMQGYYKPAN